jgi:hypothetical protein
MWLRREQEANDLARGAPTAANRVRNLVPVVGRSEAAQFDSLSAMQITTIIVAMTHLRRICSTLSVSMVDLSAK